MSYSGGFGHAPRHQTPRHHAHRHHAPRQNASRHNEHSSRRSHANMERAMIRYEDPRGGEPSERDYPREDYPRTERRSTHGYDRMQENRGRRFPYEGHDREDFPEIVGGPSDSLVCRCVRSENGRPARVDFYAQPDNEPTNYDHGPQNREESMTRFHGGQTLSPQSRRTPRNATRSHHEHARESHYMAGTDGAEWWVEYDRLHMRPTPNHQLIGYMTQPDGQDSDPVFVTNPYLTGRMAAVASRIAAHCG